MLSKYKVFCNGSSLNIQLGKYFQRRFYNLAKKGIKTPRRAVMYVPGHDEKKLNKISSLNADCILLDCEDGVGFDKKDEARKLISERYNDLSASYKREVGVRINSPSSNMASKDLKAIFDMNILPSCIAVPKIDTYEQMNWVCNEINQGCRNIEEKQKKVIDILFMCESAVSLMNIKKIIEAGICSSNVNLKFKNIQISGIIFGSDDFCADLEISRSDDAIELTYARQKLVAYAKAFQLQVIDMVYINYKDVEGLRHQCMQGAKIGFTGKQVIHPGQIETVQQSFSPTKDKIKWANELLHEYEKSDFQGVFTFMGQMIDMPTILQARNIIQMSENLNQEKS